MGEGVGHDPVVVVHADKQTLADASGARLLLTVADAQAAAGAAHVVLTGGSMGSAILASAGASPFRDLVDWSAVHLWWGDERYLPVGDPDRNDTQNRVALLDALALDPAKVHSVAGPDRSATAEASATAYALELATTGGGLFDVVLLGVGPDAHVASLFPHHPAQRRTGSATVAVHDSPKPPPDRVSLTFERLGRARQVWFLVAGLDKADAVRRALAPGADRWDVPAAGVRGQERTLWLVDADAASPQPAP
jgi:6-phosphogluconolactonase